MFFSKAVAAVLAAAGVATALPAGQPAQPISKRGVDFNWGKTPVRGVSIGGWLLLEAWITPSLFQSLDQSLNIVDEYTLTEQMGSEAALAVLKPHWDTWVTLADFEKIALAGFNTVRIPIGYWAFNLYDGETYTQGAAPYLDFAIEWARLTGLKVWVDLHGVPGSQNGFDNSGHLLPKPSFQSGNTTNQALEVLNIISQKYAQPEYQDVVVAIELLNEPMGAELDMDELKQFFRDGYGQVRDVSDTTVMMHDAFQPPSSYNGFLTPSDGASNVVVDHHEYQVFTDDFVAMTNWEHRQLVCNNAANWSGSDKWLVVGEWTAAETDCAPYLNGYKLGARYDGTYPNSTYVGSCDGKSNVADWDDNMRGDVRGYIEAQLETFEAAANGWVFWNFKTESAHEWDAFALIDAGVFPQPLTDRKYSNICSQW